jgi:hypothetical protein
MVLLLCSGAVDQIMTAPRDALLVGSQREAARRLGLSHTALQKAAHAGRIAPEPGGGWDIDKLRTQLAETADPARWASPTPAPAPAGKDEPATPDPLSAQSLAGARQGGATFHDARTANEVLKAQERRLQLDERRGRVVDKARALLLVHRLAREERDAILAWPARVAAELAVELAVDAHRLQTLLDQRLRTHLMERNGARVAIE